MFRVLMRSTPVVTAITDEDGVHDGQLLMQEPGRI